MASTDDITGADAWAEASRKMREQQLAPQVANSVHNAATVNPDAAAKANVAARFLKIPAESAAAFPDDVRRQVKVQQLDAPGLVQKAPVLSRFLTDQNNANAMHEDIPALSSIEQAVAAPWNPSLGERAHDWLNNVFGVTARQRAIAQNTLAQGMPMLTARSPVQQAISKFTHEFTAGAVPDVAGPADTFAGQAAGAAGRLGGFILGLPVVGAEKLVGGLGIKALERTAADTALKAGVRATAKGALTLGTATGISNVGEAINSPDLATGAKKEAQAVASGTATGAVFGAVAHAIPGPGVASFLGRFAANTVGTSAANGEIPLSEFADWGGKSDAEKADVLFNTVMNGFFSLHGAGSPRALVNETAHSDAAERDFGTLSAIGQVAHATKLMANDPEGMRQYLQAVTEDGHLSHVYVDGRTFADALDSAGVKAADLVNKMPEVAGQMTEALHTDGYVKIPTADFFTKINPALGDVLLQHLKTDPGGKTYAEAREFQQQQAEQMKEAAAKMVSDKGERDAFRTSQEAVVDQIHGQLDTLGRFPSEVNRINATVQGAILSRIAAREGVTPEEAFAKYGAKLADVGQKGAELDQARPGAITVDGYHFSKADRETLSSDHFGSGLKGSARDDIMNHPDKRVQKRLSFYVDTGKGILPESGVGGRGHRVKLSNVYDSDLDPLKLRSANARDFESKLLDAGYSGYLSRMGGASQGQVIMLGPQSLKAELLGAKSRIDGGERPPALPQGEVKWDVQSSGEPAMLQAKLERMQASPSWEDYDLRIEGRELQARKKQPTQGATDGQEASTTAQGGAAGDGSGRQAGRKLAPLEGAPAVKGFHGPDPSLVGVAEQYASDNGIALKRQSGYVRVDPDRAKRIADAYEAMPHDPQDPVVKEAYENLIKQTTEQYKALDKAGYKFWFIDLSKADNAGYASTPWNAMRDIRANKEMGVFPTAEGFGTKEDFDPKANPLLADTGLRWPMGGPDGPLVPVLANDLFRAVHDAFGHGLEGAGFRAEGEENAWQAHSRLFTGSALGAITTETRGQNSWLNYGPHGEANRAAKVEDTVFADQKTGLMPEWTWTEGRAGDMPEQGSFAQSASNEKLNARADELMRTTTREERDALLAEIDAKTNELMASGKATSEALGELSREGWALNEANQMEAAEVFRQGEPLAPNGKPSKLSPAHHAMVRTPEFKGWFGDWEKYAAGEGNIWAASDVSKVVDENGEPLVVYHGTDKAGFEEFNAPSGGWRNEGIFTSPDWATAASYVRKGRAREIDLVGGGGGNVYAGFLNLRNPLESYFEGANWDGQRAGKYQVDSADGERLYTEDGKGFFETREDAEALAARHPDSEVNAAEDHFESTPGVVSEARKSKGRDGAVIHEVLDDGGGATNPFDPATVYVAFEPEQFKSVQNFGKFDPTNPNMLAQSARGAPEQALGPELARVVEAEFTANGGGGDIDESADISAKSHAFAAMAQAEGYEVSGVGSKYFRVFKTLGETPDGYKREVSLNVRVSDHSNVNRGVSFGDANINIAPDDGYARDTFASALWKLRNADVNEELDTTIGGVLAHEYSFYQEARGTYSPSTQTIALLKDANLSTYLHETGHWALDTYAKIATVEGAPAEIKADMEHVLKWFGVESLDKWNAMSIDEQRPHHEQFARGFEAYLMEGKAPSQELVPFFRRIRSWMVDIYKSLQGLNVSLTPEVRGVFDRMLASEDAIAQAESSRVFEPLFKDKPDSMTPQEWDDYQTLGRTATEQAVDDMQAKSLRDMKWVSGAKSKALRASQAQAKAARRDVQDQVQEQVDAMPVYQAKAYLDDLTAPNREYKAAMATWREQRDKQPKDQRADWVEANPAPEKARTAIDDWMDSRRVEEARVRSAERERAAGDKTGLEKGQALAKAKREIDNNVERHMIEWDRENLRPVLSKPDIDFDQVAEVHGFPSGEEMLRSIMESEPKKELVDALTDRRMLEEHGELSNPADIERAANDAIHNEARARFIATGLKVLTKSPIHARELLRGAREAADGAVAAKKVRDLNPRQYEAAEAKANKAVLKLVAKDPAGAVQAQRSSLLNNQLVKSSTEAIADVKKGLEYFKKLAKPTVREKIDVAFRDQIDALLARYDLRSSLSPEQARDKNMASLEAFVEKLAAMKFSVDVPESMLTNAERMHYKDMSVEAFRGLVDAVKSLDHLGREVQKVTDGNESRLLADVAAEAVAQLEKLPQRTADTNRGLSRIEEKWINTKAFGRSLQASLLKMEQMIDWLDDYKPNGVFNRLVFRKIADAEGVRNDLDLRISQAWEAHVAALPREILKNNRGAVEMPGVIDGLTGKTQRLTWGEKIALAGIRGDAGHFAKLLKGEKWDPEAVLDFLDKNMAPGEWHFVRGLAETFQELFPLKQQMMRDLGNTSPKAVEHIPFDTAHGGMPGWYWPITYDPARSHSVKERNAKHEASLFEDNIYTRADTSTGREQTRNDNYAKPMLLSIDVLPRVLKDEIRDISTRKAIIEADRFLSHPDVRRAISSALSVEHYDTFNGWLLSLANDAMVKPSELQMWDRVAHEIRTRTTMVGLGFRVSTMVMHGTTAAGESVAEAGFKTMGQGIFDKRTAAAMTTIGPEWLQKGLSNFIRSDQFEANRDFIFERSAEMRHRSTETERDVREQLRAIHLELMDPATSTLERAKLSITSRAYQGIAMLDMASALPTWMGAYIKAMEAPEKGGLGMGEGDAVYFADKTVRNAHGGGGVKDMAAIQRGNEFQKLFTMFYTFWNHNINRIMDTAKRVKELPRTYGEAQTSGDWAGFRGDVGTLVLRTFMYTLGVQAVHHMMHPPKEDEQNPEGWLEWFGKQMALSAFGGVPLARDVVGHFAGGKDYEMSPVASIVGSTDRLLKDVNGQADGDRFIKHAMTEAGYILGMPLGQVGSTSQFLSDIWTGHQDPQDIADWWRGLTTGDMHKH